MINPQLGLTLEIVSILFVWCTYSRTYIRISSPIYIQQTLRVLPNQSIYKDNRETYIYIYRSTLVLSPWLWVFFFTGCTSPVATGSPSTAPPGYSWNLLNCRAKPTPFRSRRLLANNQLFHQSNPMSRSHGWIIPKTEDFSIRVVIRPLLLWCSAILQPGSSGILSFLLTSWYSFAITLHNRRLDAKKNYTSCWMTYHFTLLLIPLSIY